LAKLDPGVVLAERFRVEHELPFPDAQSAFVTIDQESGDRLVAFDVALDISSALRPGVGVSHPHLATIRGIVAHEDTDVLLFEHVAGHDAEGFADGVARLTRVDTVRFVLRVLDALQALHQAGACHGLVRPTAVVIDPEGRARPVLRFAPPVSGPSPYRNPERGDGAPSVEDDTWAATAVLFRLLTGRDPPGTGFANEGEVASAGVDDGLIAAAIAHGLASDTANRSPDLQRLRRELAHWFAEHAGDDSGGSSKELRPPPLPPRASVPPSAQGVEMPLATTMPSHTPGFTTSVPSAPKRKGRGVMVGAFAVLAVVIGLGAAYLVSAFRAKPRVKVVQTPASGQLAGPAPSAVSLGDIAVTGESETAGSGDRLTSCVTAHLPKGSLKKSPDLGWLCTETDPRNGGDKLKIAVVTGAAGGTTDAMRLFSQLGWYEMAAFAAVREACCQDLKPLELPPPSAGCDPLTKPLAGLGKALGAAQSYDDALTRFEKAAKCETGAKHASLFHRTGAPLPTEQAAFRELMKSVQ
jgi:hypothetical protein